MKIKHNSFCTAVLVGLLGLVTTAGTSVATQLPKPEDECWEKYSEDINECFVELDSCLAEAFLDDDIKRCQLRHQGCIIFAEEMLRSCSST